MKRLVLVPVYIHGNERFCAEHCRYFRRADTGGVCLLGETVERIKPNGYHWERCVKCLYGERRMIEE